MLTEEEVREIRERTEKARRSNGDVQVEFDRGRLIAGDIPRLLEEREELIGRIGEMENTFEGESEDRCRRCMESD